MDLTPLQTADATADDTLQQLLSQGFGKRGKEADSSAQHEKSRRLPAATPNGTHTGSAAALKQNGAALTQNRSDNQDDKRDDDNDDDDDDDDDEDEDEDDEYPVSHELVLKTHDRAVTTMTVDSSGSRMITGSVDCSIKFHDFASMTPNTLHAFKSVDPTASKHSTSTESHSVHHVEFNPISPAQVLVISATPQAKLFSRDGQELMEFVKGDMYIRDMHNTKGHISEITTGTWHPHDRERFVTAGTDSTLRIWDVNMPLKQSDVIVHKSRSAGSAGRTRMTAVAWGPKGSHGMNNAMLVSAALDGSLVMWDAKSNYSRPTAEIRDAHTPNTWTSSLDISPDGRMVVTKGGDDLIKLWDTRKFKQPINTAEFGSFSSQYSTNTIQYAPNGASILAGSLDGHLHILNPATLKADLTTPVTPGSALVSAAWHEKLNQIITTSADASVHVLYNPSTSSKGATLVMSKAPKRRHIDDDANLTTDTSLGIAGDSFRDGTTPQSAGINQASRHPTVGLTVSGRSRDPRRPHIPLTTPFAKTQPDEQHIKNNIPLSSMRDEDPREALLKYADKAKHDPMFTNAWKDTQPKTIYANVSDDDESAGKNDASASKRPKR